MMLRICEHPGCETRTLGTLCVVHEPARTPRRFPRGRPYPLGRQLQPLDGLRIAAVVSAHAGADGLLPARAVSLGSATRR
jgi:hypothetical protein